MYVVKYSLFEVPDTFYFISLCSKKCVSAFLTDFHKIRESFVLMKFFQFLKRTLLKAKLGLDIPLFWHKVRLKIASEQGFLISCEQTFL